jgi:hypothetical protein
MKELKGRLMHLFLSRRFLVLIIVFPTIVILKIKEFLPADVFGNILIWLMVLELTTNTIDKFKDKLPDIKK